MGAPSQPRSATYSQVVFARTAGHGQKEKGRCPVGERHLPSKPVGVWGSDGQPQERMKRATIPDYPRAIGKSVSASPVINANATRGLAKHGLWRSMSSRSTCRHRPCSATGTGAAKLPTGNGRGPTQRPQTPTGRLFFERLPFERWPPERWPPERSPPERSHLEGCRVQDA